MTHNVPQMKTTAESPISPILAHIPLQTPEDRENRIVRYPGCYPAAKSGIRIVGAVGALTSPSDLVHHFPPPAAIMASLIAQAHAIWFFLRISSHFEKTRNDTSLHNPFPGVYETLMYL